MLGTFLCACWLVVCLLWKNVYSGPLPIFKLNYSFFPTELYELYILDTNPLSGIRSKNIFSLSTGCLFFFLRLFLFIYLFIYYYYFFIYIYFWLCWVFVSVRGLPLVAASGGHSSSRCVGLFTIAASLVVEHRLQTCRLSSCGSRA